MRLQEYTVDTCSTSALGNVGRIIVLNRLNSVAYQKSADVQDRLFSIYLIVFFIVTSSILVPVAALLRLVTLPFDRNLRALHKLSCFWGGLYTWANPRWNVTIEGKEKVRGDVAYVIVSNHQSLVDILAAYRLFIHFKWVAKDELFKVPFIGWNMRLNRYMRIRRGDLESIRRMMRDCASALRSGSSVFLFPEGTRSLTGKVGKFRAGAFRLAKEEQVPILPIAIQGSIDALPKGRLVVQGVHHITVRVLDEIPSSVVSGSSPRELAESIRRIIADELMEMRNNEDTTR